MLKLLKLLINEYRGEISEIGGILEIDDSFEIWPVFVEFPDIPTLSVFQYSQYFQTSLDFPRFPEFSYLPQTSYNATLISPPFHNLPPPHTYTISQICSLS